MYKSTSKFQQAQTRAPVKGRSALERHKETVTAYLASQGIEPPKNTKTLIDAAYKHFNSKRKSTLQSPQQQEAALGYIVGRITKR